MLQSLLLFSALRTLLLVSVGRRFFSLANVLACVGQSSHDQMPSTAVGIPCSAWLLRFFGVSIVGSFFFE
jgi:hypothetical protein